LWKQAAIIPVCKKKKVTTTPLLAITKPHPSLIIFRFIRICYLLSYFVLSKIKISSCRHGFSKSKSIITNFETNLDFLTPLVGSENQDETTYFDQSNAFDFVPHSLLLLKLSASRLSVAM
jgi:hypothetical protein